MPFKPPIFWFQLRILWLNLRIACKRRTYFKRLRAHRRGLTAARRERKNTKAEAYEKLHSLLVSQIGLMAMGWSLFEMSLNSSIALIHRHGGAKIQPDLPASLKPKLSYLRKAPRMLEELAGLAHDANGLADKANVLKETRHDCLHGLVLMDPKDYDLWALRYRYDKDELRLRQRRMKQSDVTKALHATSQLYRASVAFYGRLAAAFQDEQAIESFRQLQIGLASIPIEEED